MKWFKHSCTARDDQKISMLMDELGLEGYGCYMIILEVVGHEMGAKDSCFASFSLRKWGSFTQLSPKRFLKFAEVMAKLSLFDVEILEKNCKINVPNLLKYRDNHTKNLQVTHKKVSLDKEKEEDKEKDKDKELKSNKKKSEEKQISEDFELFWTSTKYPKRPQDTKGDMKKKYIACRKAKLSHDDILFSSDIYAEVNRGNAYTIGLRKFLVPDTVKEYLSEDVAIKSTTRNDSTSVTLDATKEMMRRIDSGELLF